MRGRVEGSWRAKSWGSAVCWGLALLAALAAGPAWAQDADADADAEAPGYIIGVGMAFEATDDPARIAYLYEDFNSSVLEAGDEILEYRGYPVSSGYELALLILALPDVTPGEAIEMLVLRGDKGALVAEPVAQQIAPKVVDTEFLNRKCDSGSADCKCSIVSQGMSCVRTITTVVDANGKLISSTATCADGANVCNPPAPKKGK